MGRSIRRFSARAKEARSRALDQPKMGLIDYKSTLAILPGRSPFNKSSICSIGPGSATLQSLLARSLMINFSTRSAVFNAATAPLYKGDAHATPVRYVVSPEIASAPGRFTAKQTPVWCDATALTAPGGLRHDNRQGAAPPRHRCGLAAKPTSPAFTGSQHKPPRADFFRNPRRDRLGRGFPGKSAVFRHW